jgi:hypothetical protein
MGSGDRYPVPRHADEGHHMTRRTPDWKFRLLCKRCNSYKYTILSAFDDRLLMHCVRCDVVATDLDEANEPEHEPEPASAS